MARISLEESLRPDKFYRGRPKVTWLQVIKEERVSFSEY